MKAMKEHCPNRVKEWSEFGADLPKKYNPYYIYFIKEYISTLDRKSQVAYYHYIADVPRKHTSALLRMTDRQLDKLLDDIYRNAVKFLEDNEVEVFDKNSLIFAGFYDMLLDESIEEEKIAKWFNEDIATIKITRVFALQASKLQ